MVNQRKELFRNKSKGKIAGVCAGLAEYLGWETWFSTCHYVSGFIVRCAFCLYFVYCRLVNFK